MNRDTFVQPNGPGAQLPARGNAPRRQARPMPEPTRLSHAALWPVSCSAFHEKASLVKLEVARFFVALATLSSCAAVRTATTRLPFALSMASRSEAGAH